MVNFYGIYVILLFILQISYCSRNRRVLEQQTYAFTGSDGSYNSDDVNPPTTYNSYNGAPMMSTSQYSYPYTTQQVQQSSYPSAQYPTLITQQQQNTANTGATTIAGSEYSQQVPYIASQGQRQLTTHTGATTIPDSGYSQQVPHTVSNGQVPYDHSHMMVGQEHVSPSMSQPAESAVTYTDIAEPYGSVDPQIYPINSQGTMYRDSAVKNQEFVEVEEEPFPRRFIERGRRQRPLTIHSYDPNDDHRKSIKRLRDELLSQKENKGPIHWPAYSTITGAIEEVTQANDTQSQECSECGEPQTTTAGPSETSEAVMRPAKNESESKNESDMDSNSTMMSGNMSATFGTSGMVASLPIPETKDSLATAYASGFAAASNSSGTSSAKMMPEDHQQANEAISAAYAAGYAAASKSSSAGNMSNAQGNDYQNKQQTMPMPMRQGEEYTTGISQASMMYPAIQFPSRSDQYVQPSGYPVQNQYTGLVQLTIEPPNVYQMSTPYPEATTAYPGATPTYPEMSTSYPEVTTAYPEVQMTPSYGRMFPSNEFMVAKGRQQAQTGINQYKIGQPQPPRPFKLPAEKFEPTESMFTQGFESSKVAVNQETSMARPWETETTPMPFDTTTEGMVGSTTMTMVIENGDQNRKDMEDLSDLDANRGRPTQIEVEEAETPMTKVEEGEGETPMTNVKQMKPGTEITEEEMAEEPPMKNCTHIPFEMPEAGMHEQPCEITPDQPPRPQKPFEGIGNQPVNKTAEGEGLTMKPSDQLPQPQEKFLGLGQAPMNKGTLGEDQLKIRPAEKFHGGETSKSQPPPKEGGKKTKISPADEDYFDKFLEEADENKKKTGEVSETPGTFGAAPTPKGEMHSTPVPSGAPGQTMPMDGKEHTNVKLPEDIDDWKLIDEKETVETAKNAADEKLKSGTLTTPLIDEREMTLKERQKLEEQIQKDEEASATSKKPPMKAKENAMHQKENAHDSSWNEEMVSEDKKDEKMKQDILPPSKGTLERTTEKTLHGDFRT